MELDRKDQKKSKVGVGKEISGEIEEKKKNEM